MKNLFILLICCAGAAFLFPIFSFAGQNPIDELEQSITAKDWSAVYKLLNELPASDFKERAQQSVPPIVNFIRDYDSCVGMANTPGQEQDAMGFCKNVLNRLKYMPRKVFFSPSFVAELNKIPLSARDTIVKIQNELAQRRKNEELAFELRQKEEEKKEQEQKEKIALQNAALEENNKLWDKADKMALESVEYQTQNIMCNMCEQINERETSLKGMALEEKYSQKYGVMNLSLLDSYKQNIKNDDLGIASLKKAYREVTHRNFNANICKKVSADCFGTLEDLEKKLDDQNYKALKQESKLKSNDKNQVQ